MSRTKLVNVLALGLVTALAACGGSDNAGPDAVDAPPATPDAQVPCNKANAAPTYTDLYATYFAVGTPGHCAKSGCHGDPDHNVWLCGTNKDTCYQGMLGEGLINAANPVASKLSDPASSPLIWVNPGSGFMPADAATTPNAAGRDAITKWALACAQNN